MKSTVKWLFVCVFLLIFGAVVVFWTPDADVVAMRAKYGGSPSQFVDLGGGLTVHLRDEGQRDAPVVILLHGSNSFLQTWDGWTRRLKPTHRIIRFDFPGHGLTGAHSAGGYSHVAYAEIVDRIVAKLGIQRFVIVGNSMGGNVAWTYAHQHPEKLAGLVLVDASGQPEPDAQDLPLGFRIAQTPLLRDIMLHITPRSMVEEGLRKSVSNTAVVTPQNVDRYWELLRYPGNRQATIDRFTTPRDPVISGPPDAPVPTLIMWGADDRLIPVSSARWFKEQLPDARIIIYPNVGHLMMEEIPEKSSADLLNWLASLPRPR